MIKGIDDTPVGPGTSSSSPDEVAAQLRGEIESEVSVTLAGRVRDRSVTVERAELRLSMCVCQSAFEELCVHASACMCLRVFCVCTT